MPESGKKRGRPPATFTDEQSKLVETLASFGVHRSIIAETVSVTEDTLYKHFKEVLTTAKVKAVARMAGALYRSGINGNVTAQIFYLKTQGGWKEPREETIEQAPPVVTVTLNGLTASAADASKL